MAVISQSPAPLGLTDGEVRASRVPVATDGLTDTELREVRKLQGIARSEQAELGTLHDTATRSET